MFSKYSSLDRLVVRLLGRACKEEKLIECQNKTWNWGRRIVTVMVVGILVMCGSDINSN